MATHHMPDISLDQDQKRTFLQAKVKRFEERFKELEAETGMTYIAVLDIDPIRGVIPIRIPVEKRLLKAQDEPQEATTHLEK